MRSLGRRPTSRDVAAAMARRTTRILAIRPRCRRRCGRTGSSPRAPKRDRRRRWGRTGSSPRAPRRNRPCPWEPWERPGRAESGRHAPLWHLLRPVRAGQPHRTPRRRLYAAADLFVLPRSQLAPRTSADRCTEKGVGSQHGRWQPDHPGGSRVRILDRGRRGASYSWLPGPGPRHRAAIRRERGRLRAGPGAEHPAARRGAAPVPGRRVRHGPGQPDRGPHPRGESAAQTPATAIAGSRRRDRSLRRRPP